MGRASALSALLLASACGSSGQSNADAGTDSTIDASLVFFPVTGAYIDWDATSAAPCPIVGAKWFAHYDDTHVAMTDANGS